MFNQKRRLVRKLERLMLEEEMESQFLEDQHSRAYHSGVIDGLGKALFALSPKAAKRNPVSIVWFDEDYDKPRKLERQREQSFDMCYAGLFDTAEVD